MSGVDELAVNTLRFLSVDMVEKARSGHPGLPLGAAPMAYVLWDRFLRHDPTDPAWPDRDRFVLSAGHGSALLYSLLHTTGYDLPISELQRFRQVGSKAPGHPERGVTPGVEATTGPLGQGFGNAIGMALAQTYLAHRYNRPGHPIVDHWTYSLCSDGDLMEGIASEAASFAGSMKVGKLLFLYDDNHVSLEGPTSYSFTEDVGARFTSYGWGVRHVEDGNDLTAIDRAIREAREDRTRPQLIRVRTHIGYGSPRQDTKDAHGEPLGADGTRSTKQRLGWPLEPTFLVPPEAGQHLREAIARGRLWSSEWRTRFEAYRREFPDLAAEYEAALTGRAPVGWDAELPVFDPANGPIATRDAAHTAMQSIARHLPGFVGGSADLSPSTKTTLDGLGDFSTAEAAPCGPNLHFGVRENAMVSMLNGLALHGGIRPFGSTFLVFSDYARPSIRLAALTRLPVILVFTHDSVALGEDGPTHQPIEHLASLRAMPGLTVIRPADANETTEAWRSAIASTGPVALVLTRQKLPVLDRASFPIASGAPKGAFVLADPPTGSPTVVLIGTGSEVHLCLAAAASLSRQGVAARVVSMPCWELFDAQPPGYRTEVLPTGVPIVSVEAASPLGWSKYVPPGGRVIGLDRFGESGPGPAVLESLGLTVDRVVSEALAVARPKGGPNP